MKPLWHMWYYHLFIHCFGLSSSEPAFFRETNFDAWKHVFALGQKHFSFLDTNYASGTYVSPLSHQKKNAD